MTIFEPQRSYSREDLLKCGDGRVSCDGKDIYFASDLRVGLFQNTDSF